MDERSNNDDVAGIAATRTLADAEYAESMAERGRALAKHIADKDRAIDELNETAGAFKLLNEKQTAELNARDLLLTRKNERIEELLQLLKERDTQLQSKDRAIERLNSKFDERDAEFQELRDQLAKEEEEFSMLSAAMEIKEQQLNKKSDEVLLLKDVERQFQKDVDRLQVQLRRVEKQVDDLHPEKMDACLSPRSFSENQLIQLRDDAINAKTKEIWLLAGKNDQLRIQLDEVEGELERLQTSFVSKENDLARRDRKIEKLEAEIEALQVSRQQAEGRERAIEIATTQNTKLLQALQAQEVQAEDVRNRLEQAERECLQLRQAHRQNLEKSAVNEVEVLHKSKEAEHKSGLLSALQEKLIRERKALHEELSQERMKSQLEVEKLQSELVMRRNKQYELTLRLQEVDAKLHQATDQLETTSEQYIVTKLRMEEAERVLHDALVWKRALEDELVSCRNDGDAKKKSLENEVNSSRAEASTLRVQLGELKESLLKSLHECKNKDFRVQELRRVVEGKDQLVVEQRERIARLVQEIAKGSETRAKLELEKNLMGEQLDRIKRQMGDSLRECMEQQKRVDSKWKKARDQCNELEKECANEQRGKSKLVRLFVQAYGAAVGAASSPKATAPHNVISPCLDLRECWLADHDLTAICSAMESPAARRLLTRVDLRSNRLTQDGVRSIIQYLRKCLTSPLPGSSSNGSPCCVRELDLRGNFISIEGMRLVANALEGLASPDDASREPPFAKVLVISGGRIECYPSQAVSNNEIPALTVDVTENGDAETLTQIAQPMAQRVTNRRKRDDGDSTGAPAASRIPVTVDPVLQQIYGLDLVSAFMGEPKTSTNPVNSSRARRKSTERARFGASIEGDTIQSTASPLLPSYSSLVELHSNNNSSFPTSSPRTFPIRDASRTALLTSPASLPRL